MNHSLVTEYTVLYTFDVLKKLKKWHEGMLKVYHINKKAIVFDEAERVICDEFIDCVENLQDFALSNVLVSVEEQKCIYERDVSGMAKGQLIPVKLISGEKPRDFVDCKGTPVEKGGCENKTLSNTRISKGRVIKPRRVGLSRPKRLH